MTRYQENEESGLVRKAVSGRPRKLQEIDNDLLTQIVLVPASKYGFETNFWTTRRLIQVIRSEFEVKVSKQTVTRQLHEAGLSYQKPEREYFELSEEERAEWVRQEVPRIRRAVRQHRAILYLCGSFTSHSRGCPGISSESRGGEKNETTIIVDRFFSNDVMC